MADPSGTTDGLDAEVGATLRRWGDRTNRRAEIATPPWTAKGYTGATISAVFVTNKPPAPQRPAKLILKHIPSPAGDIEAARHHEAISSAPAEFARQHMVHLFCDPVEVPGHGLLLLQEIAGDSLVYCRSLEELRTVDPAAVGRDLLTVLLRDWTARDPRIVPDAVTAAGYLAGEVAASTLGLDRGGTARSLGIGGDPEVRLPDGTIVLNPLLADHPALGGQELRYLTGPVHGDMHTGNVLIPVSPGGEVDVGGFWLIDFSAYQHDGPVSRDVTMLLMSLIWRRFSELGPAGSRTAVSCLTSENEVDSLPAEVAGLIDEVRRMRHTHRPGPGLPDVWEEQFQLSLCAAALLHSGLESLPGDVRRSCFELSARLATGFVDRRLNPGRIAAPPVVVPVRGAPRAGQEDRRRGAVVSVDGRIKIAEALLRYPALLNESSRMQLLTYALPEQVQHLPHASTARLHVLALVDWCMTRADGENRIHHLLDLLGEDGERRTGVEVAMDTWWQVPPGRRRAVD